MNRQQDFDVAAVRAIIAERKGMAGAMLPILHGIQEKLGYIPSDVVPMVADGLNVSRAEVHGVVSFYHFFRQQPPGRHVVQVCRAEACQARGADALAGHAQEMLGCAFHETTADGQFTLEPVYCLGQCACGPNIMIDDDLHARVGADKFQRLVQAKREA
ncbi:MULTISPECIES: formate dehydrogenase subunit gamma [unclassified Herbaspirillum]|uniref:formate dehydrogenase subunit gamma n=1 Tax=unclassified Herbaspirillum TaxID=2624150 RepID=UPI0011519728|nr:MULTISPECIES: formate dehydrogenase subunit gamma [unclassified Herbaspirillum]MBB5391123.1 formate dehydrogenase subunit gamma [Herbaspirillum sp. SJZ102]TQK13186.1 formate dehydrogenase gamma subunit [Herbaspirillum sp. SJZ130]TQK15190.1 formate dehydrogenase gamma subunit [Herbaspirillum sp. SJZ106]TWC67540.1 formate dehydrogenase gamma subunit [Herbaspirillum sp. SJZ099]